MIKFILAPVNYFDLSVSILDLRCSTDGPFWTQNTYRWTNWF